MVISRRALRVSADSITHDQAGLAAAVSSFPPSATPEALRSRKSMVVLRDERRAIGSVLQHGARVPVAGCGRYLPDLGPAIAE
jgi:hypothetical protein